MKEISCIREFSGDSLHKPLSMQISKEEIEGKQKVLTYLKSFPIDCAAGMSLVDEITGETQKLEVNGYEDGVFYWDSREIYHFEKYNMKLDTDFVQYILNK